MSPQVSVPPSQKMLQLFFLHIVYYTPKKLFRYGYRVDDKCPRCQGTGDLIHMMWRCPKLFRYWNEILEDINSTFGLKLELDATICLLGKIEENNVPVNIKLTVIRCLFQARKIKALNWQSVRPPTLEECVKVMAATVWREKVVFTRQRNLDKFLKMWKPWLKKMGCPP